MSITGHTKTQLKRRLAKALGHLDAVYQMVENEKYCIDVLHQLKAVQSALDRTAELMLKQHLETCVVEAVKTDDSARVMEEVWQLLRKDRSDQDCEELSKLVPIPARGSCCE